MGQPFGHISPGGSQKPLLHGFRHRMYTRAGERFFQQVDGLAFRFFTVWTEIVLSGLRIVLPGGDRHNLIVQAAGIRPVERQPAKQDHPAFPLGALASGTPRTVNQMDLSTGFRPANALASRSVSSLRRTPAV